MKNLKILNSTVLIVLISLMFSCSQEEEIAPAEISDVESVIPGNISGCEAYTATVWADTPYQNSISMSHGQSKTFRTNKVCGATSYTWTVDDQASISTSIPSIQLSGLSLVWLPAGGCKDFNKKWTSSNPLFTGACGWVGQIPYGTYASKIKVKANNSSVSVTLPVYVSGVELCIESDPCKGNGYGIFDPGEVPDPSLPVGGGGPGYGG